MIQGGEYKMKKSRKFFIITAIFLILTIICIIVWSNYQNKADKNVWNRGYRTDYQYETDKTMLERQYNQGTLSFSEYQEKVDKLNKEYDKGKENKEQDYANIMLVVSCCLGAVTIILLSTGIVLKVKEKHKI